MQKRIRDCYSDPSFSSSLCSAVLCQPLMKFFIKKKSGQISHKQRIMILKTYHEKRSMKRTAQKNRIRLRLYHRDITFVARFKSER